MKTEAPWVLPLWLLCLVAALGQRQAAAQGSVQGQPPYVGPATETVAPDIPGVVKGGTRIEVVKEGFQGTEGPIALPDGSLIFTEGDRITKIDKDGKTSTFLEDTNRANGLAFDAKGRLIAAQGNRVGVIYPNGNGAVFTDNFEGKPYLRPNDLVVDKKGGVYFTDFTFVPPGQKVAPAPGSLPPAVYYVRPGGQAIKVAEDGRPNGIILSPGEKTLYINTDGEYLLAFDVQNDGTLTNRRDFGKYAGIPPGQTPRGDGLAVDSEGRVYAVMTGGVQVFSPTGQHLGNIPFSRVPQNLAFGGPDKKTLYVVGRGVVFKVPMLAQGYKGRAK